MILIDTNVFSEITKPTPDDNVVDWLLKHRNQTLLSTIVVAELTVGPSISPAPLRGENSDRPSSFESKGSVHASSTRSSLRRR